MHMAYCHMAIWQVVTWFLLVVIFALEPLCANEDGQDHFEIYAKLFELKRQEQIQTAEQVWSVSDYAKQYKTVKFLMEAIFPILEQSLADASKMGFKPGDPFPKELEDREVLGKIYENILFFGDVLLRMPDTTKKIYRQHREWRVVLEDSIKFCNASKELFRGPHAKQLHLMAQELGMVAEDADYVNPFRTAEPHPDKEDKVPDKKKNQSKKKQKRSSGPKLRGSKLNSEL